MTWAMPNYSAGRVGFMFEFMSSMHKVDSLRESQLYPKTVWRSEDFLLSWKHRIKVVSSASLEFPDGKGEGESSK